MKWTESIDIARPLAHVQRAIADEHQLMQWSAWPAATGYSCSVQGDGTSIGSEIVFRDPAGDEQGRQRLTVASPTRVEYRLRNRGPGGRDMPPRSTSASRSSPRAAPGSTWTSETTSRYRPRSASSSTWSWDAGSEPCTSWTYGC